MIKQDYYEFGHSVLSSLCVSSCRKVAVNFFTKHLTKIALIGILCTLPNIIGLTVEARGLHRYREMSISSENVVTSGQGLIPYKKSVVSEMEYICALGAFYNLTCSHLLNAHFPYEEVFYQTRDEPISSDAPNIIDPQTHRIWLTSADAPKEVSADRLAFYNHSLQFYKDKPFEHHFWCNDKNLIPETIKTIRNFNVPVIIHEVGEIEEMFITKKLYKSLLEGKHFAVACNLARQEILLQYGGLYMDIGLEQLRDIGDYFKRYDWIQTLGNGPGNKHLNDFALGAPKGSNLLRNSLKFSAQIPELLNKIPVLPDGHALVLLNTLSAWRLAWATEKAPKSLLGFVFRDSDFNYHGFASWHNGQWGMPGWTTYITVEYYMGLGR